MKRPGIHDIRCPYCGRRADFLESSARLYGRDYGPVYACLPCRAWVGCHDGTTNPLGTMADEHLRGMRRRAHEAFDPIWRLNAMSRRSAHKWLADQIGVEARDCHIAMMDADQCHLVEAVAMRWREEGHMKPKASRADRRAERREKAATATPPDLNRANPDCRACGGRGLGVAMVDGTDDKGRRRGWTVRLACPACRASSASDADHKGNHDGTKEGGSADSRKER